MSTELKLERPNFHFTPPANWINDPNGLVYYQGEYHLFYQYHPYSKSWGPMHWGHAVSSDLINWEHLPVALEPDELGMIFSGSAVVDANDTTGFFDGVSGLVAIYTNCLLDENDNELQRQSIAYSKDKGRTWTKYEGNPVIPNPGIKDFRDPKVFWHQNLGKWIMVLAAKDKVFIYSSTDLIDWEYRSKFTSQNIEQGIWECPELFSLEKEGEKHWVLKIDIVTSERESNTYYFIGDFNGIEFKEYKNDQPQKIDYGRDFYAAQSWNNHPQNKKVWIAWMNDWTYAKKVPFGEWRNAMTCPRQLSLIKNEKGFDLAQSLTDDYIEHRECLLSDNNLIIDANSQQEYSLEDFSEVELVVSTINSFKIKLGNNLSEWLKVAYDKLDNSLIVDRSQSGICDFEKSFSNKNKVFLADSLDKIKLNIIKDKYSIELFINQGKKVMTSLIFPREEYSQVTISAQNEIKLDILKFYSLNL